MSNNELTRILCVDDEPRVLDALARALRRHYAVTTAVGAEEGLARLEREDPFVVVVSDLRMPGTDGVAFLGQVRHAAPDAVRILLTGQADLASAIGAVNDGAVFRFLTKPTDPEALLRALGAAEAQHRLVAGERVLLEETLHGSIRALTEVLAMRSPGGFGRAVRLRHLVQKIDARLRLRSRWQVEVAAMLSQIGAVMLPDATIEKLNAGDPLTPAEAALVEQLPKMASAVVASIPRLEEVSEILAHLNCRFDGHGAAPRVPSGTALPLGARLLRIVADLDALEMQGGSRTQAVEALRNRRGWYDPTLLDAVADVPGDEPAERVIEITLGEIQPGMVIAEDVRVANGTLTIARGQEISEHIVQWIRCSGEPAAIDQRVRIVVPHGVGVGAEAAAVSTRLGTVRTAV